MNILSTQRGLLFAATLCLLSPIANSVDDIELPVLGDSLSGLVSPREEKALGDYWIRAFRARAKTLSDPLTREYTANLIANLANYSELHDKQINLVMVDSPTINAFAVPGGVMGVNGGLFLHAETEEELAAVIAHELAHLSQRHFARSIENAQARNIPTMAGMLAGLVILAAGGGDAGIATIAATQAAAVDSQLAHSRLHEKEADRFGMDTLARAGMDPMAMSTMFEHMLANKRLSGNAMPEFLLTHPATESRVADSRSRASRFPATTTHDTLDFHLIKARMRLFYSETPDQAVQYFHSAMQVQHPYSEADRYGYVISLTAANRLSEARHELEALLKQDELRIGYQVAAAEIDLKDGLAEQALRRLKQHLKLAPGNHPLSMTMARALLATGQVKPAESLLLEHARKYPQLPEVWYELAEVHGLAGNILGVHVARAEYFMLTGIFDEASRQLKYAMQLAQGDHFTSALLRERSEQLKALRETQL